MYGEIKKYPDQFSYAKIDIAGEYKIPTVNSFTFKINSYEDLWHLNQVVDVYTHLGMRPTITIPCLPDAQADRRFNLNESSGLKLVCKFLNGMKADFKIFHPHNQEVVEALMNNVEIIDNKDFIVKVLSTMYTADNLDNYKSMILMSSDAGGFKPLMKLCDKIGWQGSTYSASKARVWDGKESRLTQVIARKDFEGKDILIIDDICVYGGTFKGLAKLLRERNCGKLYLAVSNMTVQQLGVDPVTDHFDKVFTTNSKYDEYFYGIDGDGSLLNYIPKNLEIIKMF